MGHVVPIAHIGDGEARELALVLSNRQSVCQALAGMKIIGERVDDGNACPLGDLDDLALLVGAQYDGIDKALEHERRVLHGLATTERRVVIAHDERVRPQTIGANLEARARAQTWLLHDDGNGLARAGSIVHAVLPVGLLPCGRIEHERELLGRQIEQTQAIASGERVLAHCATSSYMVGNASASASMSSFSMMSGGRKRMMSAAGALSTKPCRSALSTT